MTRLFHISDDDSIIRFEPRLPPSVDTGIAEHLPNYLLPRDCPRVTYYQLPTSKQEDIQDLIGPSLSHHVIAIEAAWFERSSKNPLWIYEFISDSFFAVDIGAGYYISKVAVVPRGKRKITEPLAELVSCGVELRVVSSLWPLRDAVIGSSLQFSCIRIAKCTAQDRVKPTEMKAVIFDLDQTLLDRDQSLLNFLRWQCRGMLRPYVKDEEQFISRFIDLDSNGTVWKDKVYETLLEEFDIKAWSSVELLSVYENCFCGFSVPREGVRDALLDLSRSHKIGLISNGMSPFQERNFRGLGLSGSVEDDVSNDPYPRHDPCLVASLPARIAPRAGADGGSSAS